MKKSIIFSFASMIAILVTSANLFAGNPRGHKAYVKHSKHHKAHKIHRPHGRVDATYQN